jgi:hypothetical protein
LCSNEAAARIAAKVASGRVSSQKSRSFESAYVSVRHETLL